MNAFTRMSERGQVVVPKVLRDRKGWVAGTDLEVTDTGDGLLLRSRRDPVARITPDEAVARLRRIYTHAGPPRSVEELGWSPDADGPDR